MRAGQNEISGVEADLHERAVLAAGYHDFGDAGYREGLGRLLAAIDSSDYTAEQRERIRKHLVLPVLRGRLYSERGWHERPECLRASVQSPLIVCGLPRTGTTALHRLLSMDHRLQGLNGWLVSYPMPRPPRDRWTSFPEFRAVAAIQADAMSASATTKTANLRTADEVDEPLELISQSFTSNLFPAMFRLPAYDEWFRGQSQLPSYRRLADNLRLIGSNDPDKPWLLQNPTNIQALEDLFEVFPDARIVWTHRHPKNAIASLSSLLGMVRRSMLRADVRIDDIAAREVSVWSQAVKTATMSHDRHAASFHDVDFRQFGADPMGTVRGIYERFGMDIDSKTKSAMQGWIAANPQGKHGVHAYDRDPSALSDGLIAEQFGDYIERFDLG